MSLTVLPAAGRKAEPPKAGEAPLVCLDDAAFGYDGRPAVLRVSGGVEAGSLTAIVGPNGSGKSTLFKGIAGLLEPLHGRVARGGLRRGDIAYMPQIPEIDRSFPASVAELVSLGLWPRRGALSRFTAADRAEIGRALEAVGLGGCEGRSIGSLSGGQMQRALFARAMLQDARLILLDEPFNAIDTSSVDDLLAVIHRWRHEGRTVMTVLHDLDLVRAHFPRTLLLAGEPVAWGRTADVLRPEHLLAARRFTDNRSDAAPWRARSAA